MCYRCDRMVKPIACSLYNIATDALREADVPRSEIHNLMGWLLSNMMAVHFKCAEELIAKANSSDIETLTKEHNDFKSHFMCGMIPLSYGSIAMTNPDDPRVGKWYRKSHV